MRVFASQPRYLIEYDKDATLFSFLGEIPEEITPIIWLNANNANSLKLTSKVITLNLSCCRANWRISRKEIAFHFFSKFCKEPALSNASSTADHNKAGAS